MDKNLKKLLEVINDPEYPEEKKAQYVKRIVTKDEAISLLKYLKKIENRNVQAMIKRIAYLTPDEEENNRRHSR